MHSSLSQIGQREDGWSTDTLQSIASRLFMDIQKAYCDQDEDGLNRLTKGAARVELSRELSQLRDQGHKNRMDDLRIDQITVLNVQNFLDDEQDNFTVKVAARARDYTVDHNGVIVSANTRKKKRYTSAQDIPAEPFQEFWTFEREGDDWVLLELAQAAAWKSVVDRPFIDQGTLAESPSNRYPEAGTAPGVIVPA